MTKIPFAVFENVLILKICAVIFRILKQEPLKKLGSLIWLVLVWVNLNSLQSISFKGRLSGCMRDVLYVR